MARPGATDGLSPDVTAGLDDVRRGTLRSLYGDDWEAAGARLDVAFTRDGAAAYARLGDVLPASFRDAEAPAVESPAEPGGLHTLSIRPEPSAWVGTDGEPVQMSRDETGRLTLGANASPELRRFAGYMSDSGSDLALALFVEASYGPTKLNFRTTDPAGRAGLNGLHEAHDANGPVKWEAGDRNGTTGQFERPPDYVVGPNGERAYREATITMFEDNFTPSQVQAISRAYGDGSALTRQQVMAAVFAHELFHDVNDRTVEAIFNRLGGKPDTYAVEAEAYRMERLVLAEIQGTR